MAFGEGPFGSMPFGGVPEGIEAAFDVDRRVGGQTIITVTSFVDQALLKFWLQNPQDLRLIDRRKFEELVAELFNGFGYEVELTKRTRDGGKDIVAIKRNAEADVKYLIECKRPNPGKPVGVKTVRELHSVKITEGATKAILATTTHFTHDAKQLFEQHRWELELRDFESIQQWIAEYLRIQRRR
jgi:restriction system protein